MKVSVVICTYSLDLFKDLVEAAESVLNQTYSEVELIIIVDGREEVYSKIDKKFGGNERIKTHLNDENKGLSLSRNKGIELSTGDIIAFMDDDAVADQYWISELVDTYQETDALAVGGKMTPIWINGKPQFLPEEFYWLIGVTYKGFREDEGEVMNTFGSNISFRREVLEELGGFNPEFGRKGEKHLQGEETEIAWRMNNKYSKKVIYNPEAKVGHKVFKYRTNFRWLVMRAFWQGYSKKLMNEKLPDISGNETKFLSKLFREFIPHRTLTLIKKPRITRIKQLLMLILLTSVVGLGYLYGFKTKLSKKS